ncbi:MAG: transcriptional regulator [Nocardioidaceae bacterium]
MPRFAPDDFAYPRGVDPRDWSRQLHRAHDDFVATGRASGDLRPLVVESWRRSLTTGVDPEKSVAEVQLVDDALEAARAEHPLSSAMPVIRRLLVDSAAEAGLLVALSDAAGRLLWVEGASRLRTRAAGMHFVEGANWSESAVGTNAPGTALALDRAVQIFGAEHLARPVTPWSCSAAPIHDPETGAMLGVLDLTGGPEVATPQSMSLVRATVAAVESELRVEQLLRQRPEARPSAPLASLQQNRTPLDRTPLDRTSLSVLGARGGLLRFGTTATRLSLRHSELLLLLSEARDGLSAGELAVALSSSEQASVTVRAELSRLRSLLGPLRMQSRPYRLEGRLHTDVGRVRSALQAGDLRGAVAEYRGPILPQSEAPAVMRMRADLHGDLRAVLCDRGDPDALLRFADTPHGHEDLPVWQAALGSLPAGSPRRAQVQSHVERLAAALA